MSRRNILCPNGKGRGCRWREGGEGQSWVEIKRDSAKEEEEKGKEK